MCLEDKAPRLTNQSFSTDWEPALSDPLPTGDYSGIERVRQVTIRYLDWVTHDLVLGDVDGAIKEIERVANRLVLIATASSIASSSSASRRHSYEKPTRKNEATDGRERNKTDAD